MNIYVKFFRIWTSGSGDVVKNISYLCWPFCLTEQILNLEMTFKEKVYGWTTDEDRIL